MALYVFDTLSPMISFFVVLLNLSLKFLLAEEIGLLLVFFIQLIVYLVKFFNLYYFRLELLTPLLLFFFEFYL